MFLLRMALLFVLVFGILYASISLRRRFARRTVRTWRGVGPNPDLTPVQASVLLGFTPSLVVAIEFDDLYLRGRVRVSDIRPLTFEPLPDGREEPGDRRFLDALHDRGRMPDRAAIDLLEALYEETCDAMKGWSCWKTAAYLEDKVAELWRVALEEGIPADELLPWLLLRDGNQVWDLMPEGGRWDLLRELYRTNEKIKENLFFADRLQELSAGRGSGFFAARREASGVHP